MIKLLSKKEISTNYNRAPWFSWLKSNKYCIYSAFTLEYKWSILYQDSKDDLIQFSFLF